MEEKIERLVLNLTSDKRFKILDDKNIVDIWEVGGLAFHEYTELESNNLKILYVKERFFGKILGEEIKVLNKNENSSVFCGSSILDDNFKEKSIRKTYFKIEELKDYIDKNA